MNTRLVPLDVPGLNLLLGGGVPVLARGGGNDESAVLLIRGPPGSGKTVLGAQLAGALARAIVPGERMDVAYGCVGLHPEELAAQHAGIAPPDLPERVVLSPFPVDAPEPRAGGACRIYADRLACAPEGTAAAVERLLDRAGDRVRVVVVDAIPAGAPESLAGALSSLAAARGMVFVLLEETIEGRPDPFRAVADVVLELGPSSLAVTKSRFGRAEPGPHEAAIQRGSRYTVWPEPAAYLSGVQPAFPRQGGRSERVWGHPQLDDPTQRWPRLLNQTVAVIGTDAPAVRRLAFGIGRPDGHETELIVLFDDLTEGAEKSVAARARTIRIAGPHAGGARVLAEIVEAARSLAEHGALARVVVGDTRTLRLFSAREEIVRSLMILSSVLRRADVPLVVFDSSISSGPVKAMPAGDDLPLVADFADVKIVGWCAADQRSVSATLGANKRIEWRGFL